MSGITTSLKPNDKIHHIGYTRKHSIHSSCPDLHASSGCRSSRVHRLDVTGGAASHHEAPAHSITDNLRSSEKT
ncbi:hypothetical protein EYF80_037644 [Liparis tanakae]|uniref:Uncharacterized protein n=1 Tax=Liparis tanakae TaxID=230148 RepID=A0A4Z2GHL7_9TELE|nr:hypothetical protein EYF80_037644 [Liparis tanakae]